MTSSDWGIVPLRVGVDLTVGGDVVRLAALPALVVVGELLRRCWVRLSFIVHPRPERHPWAIVRGEALLLV